jgi:hypothetical protein
MYSSIQMPLVITFSCLIYRGPHPDEKNPIYSMARQAEEH